MKLHLGEIWHLISNPFFADAMDTALQAIPHGALLVDDAGKIAQIGAAADLIKAHPAIEIVDHGDSLLLPGFIDGHLHYPQLDIIGCYGEQLLGWLNRYTFPTEAQFSDPDIANDTAQRLITELYANGTTTAVLFGSTHASAAATMFQAALDRGLRAIIGKVSMDRHAPVGVLQDVDSDLRDSEALITQWHGRAGRLHYALTPRFVPTCSEALLAGIGQLHARHPDLFVQTHWAENQAEIAWVKELCPADCDYLGVYERHGLLGPKTILAHAIHVDNAMLDRVAAAGAILAHCPTSNLFLGSGLFPLDRVQAHDIRVVIGTDIGGGTSLSLWRTLEETYKVQQLRGKSLTPAQLLYLATLGAATGLGMQDQLGNLLPGKAADFQVVDWRRHRLLAARFTRDLTPDEKLFALITLADDRVTDRVYVQGREVYVQAP
jgi:guanine deaminase